jgi:5-methylcytosine-specific restriction endonuclease McrA
LLGRRQQRATRRAGGLTCRGKPCTRTAKKLVFVNKRWRLPRGVLRADKAGNLWRLNARQAWSWWIKAKAPNRWLRAYYRSLGKPWLNPRLAKSTKARIRYWCDVRFRAREIERIQRLKVKRGALIAATDDRTLTVATIIRLFSQAAWCHYCGKRMRATEKSLDHCVPLSRGGRHSITNVVVCCKSCNSRKRTRTSVEFLASRFKRGPF